MDQRASPGHRWSIPERFNIGSDVVVYKAGLVAVPLFKLFGEEALEFRLQDSGARAIVTDRDELPKLERLRQRLPELRLVLCADGPGEGAVDLPAALERASSRFDAVPTAAEDPAIIIYTSGTTGQPKGALHAHRVLLGHLPGVEHPHDGFPRPGDRFWTPADWAWIGGLFDVLLPAWHHGVPVVAYRARKFDPGEALRLLERHEVRNVFMPPTALKLLRTSGAAGTGARLRTLASGGESLGEDLIEWGRATFGLTINEFYGQTECNLVVGNGSALPPVRPGWMGTAIPGHTVGIVDEAGRELPRRLAGEWRPGDARRGRLLPLRRPRRRRDHQRRLPHRARRDRDLPAAAPRGGPRRRGRRARSHPDRGHQGRGGAQAGEPAVAVARRRPSEPCPVAARRARVPAHRGVRGRAAAHRDRQDRPPGAALAETVTAAIFGGGYAFHGEAGMG